MNHKSIILITCLVSVLSPISFSQSNTFPASGDVGIGTTIFNYAAANRRVLEINGTSQALLGFNTGGAYKGYIFHSGTDFYLINDVVGELHLGTSAITRMIIRSDGRVGIGTTSPNRLLQVGSITPGASSDQNADILSTGGIMILSGKMLSLDHSYYVHAYQKFQGVGDDKGFLHYGYYGHEFSTRTGSAIVIKGNSNYVGIGTTNPQNKLDVNGTIRAKEFKAQITGWYDHVFEKDYSLMPLSDLEDFVHTNKRLPDLPPASEVVENGIDLGTTNALLLKKIEELTLYVIELNKKIEKLESEKQGN